jgi:hypothetical protein
MSRVPLPDPDVKPPEYRVPRGRSGVGSESALQTLLADLERVRRAKEAYGDLPPRAPVVASSTSGQSPQKER